MISRFHSDSGELREAVRDRIAHSVLDLYVHLREGALTRGEKGDFYKLVVCSAHEA